MACRAAQRLPWNLCAAFRFRDRRERRRDVWKLCRYEAPEKESSPGLGRDDGGSLAGKLSARVLSSALSRLALSDCLSVTRPAGSRFSVPGDVTVIFWLFIAFRSSWVSEVLPGWFQAAKAQSAGSMPSYLATGGASLDQAIVSRNALSSMASTSCDTPRSSATISPDASSRP